jgi:hypothetical protein
MVVLVTPRTNYCTCSLTYKLQLQNTIYQCLYWTFCCRYGVVWVVPWNRYLLCCCLWNMWGLCETSGPDQSHGWVAVVNFKNLCKTGKMNQSVLLFLWSWSIVRYSKIEATVFLERAALPSSDEKWLFCWVQ